MKIYQQLAVQDMEITLLPSPLTPKATLHSKSLNDPIIIISVFQVKERKTRRVGVQPIK